MTATRNEEWRKKVADVPSCGAQNNLCLTTQHWNHFIGNPCKSPEKWGHTCTGFMCGTMPQWVKSEIHRLFSPYQSHWPCNTHTQLAQTSSQKYTTNKINTGMWLGVVFVNHTPQSSACLQAWPNCSSLVMLCINHVTTNNGMKSDKLHKPNQSSKAPLGLLKWGETWVGKHEKMIV